LCVYIYDLLLLLSKAGVGCYIGSNFVGALAYADDVVLIALTAIALRTLLIICMMCTNLITMQRDINVVKTKCMVVVPCRHRALFEELLECVSYIGIKPIEFVNSFIHFINSELSDDEGIAVLAFIVNNTLSYLRSLDSLGQHKLFQSYLAIMVASYGY